MEVKNTKYNNTIMDKSSHSKTKIEKELKSLNNRKISFNLNPKSRRITDRHSVSGKADLIKTKDFSFNKFGQFKLGKLHVDSEKCYLKPNFLRKSTAYKEDDIKIKEIYELTKEINRKLLKGAIKTDKYVQVDDLKYIPKNPSNLTMNSILREVATNELFGIKPQLLETLLNKADSDLKRFLLITIVNQYKLQSVSEEILIELKNQGFDVEKFVYEVYDQLGIRPKEPVSSSETLIMDTEMSDAITGLKLDLDHLN